MKKNTSDSQKFLKSRYGDWFRAIIETGELASGYIQHISYAMNIEMNYVHNSNIRIGNCDFALEYFERILRVKPNLAITCYYVAACLDQLGDSGERDRYLERAIECANSTPFWKDYIDMFGIPLLSNMPSAGYNHV